MRTIKSLFNSILRKNNYELKNIKRVAQYIELDNSDRDLIDKILDEDLTMTSAERLLATFISVKHVCNLNIQGDIVECGVWRGGNSIVALYALNKLNNNNKALWMYDTFKGMTKPSLYDFENSDGKLAKEEFDKNADENHNNWCYASLQDVNENIKNYRKGVEVKMIEGDIIETLKIKSNIPSSISVLRLDTDWYESTKKELEILYPKLSTGGVLIIDDYGHWGGCKKAVDEYFSNLEKKPLLIPSDYTGRMAIKT